MINHYGTLKTTKATWKHEKLIWNLKKTMKTNLSYTGWLRLVTGDSKEELMIFHYRQTLHYNIYIIIIIKPCFNIGSASKEEKI